MNSLFTHPNQLICVTVQKLKEHKFRTSFVTGEQKKPPKLPVFTPPLTLHTVTLSPCAAPALWNCTSQI